MSEDVRPLTEEERDALYADWRCWLGTSYDQREKQRLLATIEAVEAERDAALARAERLRGALVAIYQAPIADAWHMARAALRADDEARGE